jgi:hypothetical protein
MADVNRDGIPDVIVANGGGSVGVLLGNGDGTFQASVTYPTILRSVDAVAIGDFNGDGWPDVVAGSNDGFCILACISVFLNNGDGTFQAAVGFSTVDFDITSMVATDVDGDGNLDVVVSNQCHESLCTDGSTGVLLGNGDGTFRATSYVLGKHSSPESVAVADLNHDGKPDLLVADFSPTATSIVTVLLNKGDGTFPTQVAYPTGGFVPSSVIAADVNGDGKLDIVATNFYFSKTILSYGTVSVLLGNGDGTFGKAVVYSAGPSPYAAAVGDFNGDGAIDVVVASGAQFGGPNVRGQVSVLSNNGDGTLRAPTYSYATSGLNAYSVAVTNLNQDGNIDLVVADGCDGFFSNCPSGGVAVLFGKATRTTTTIASSANPSNHGQAVTFTATIAPVDGLIPNGTTVAFLSDAKQIGTATMVNGVAQFITSSLMIGTHRIKASFPSSSFFTASSATLEQVVN